MKKTVIFFLAHDGVKQPALWEKWLASDLSNSIKIRIFCNIDHSNDAFIVKDGRYLNLNIETAWGGSSLVKVLQLGYTLILDEFKEENIKMIHLVSGFDIPVMSAKKLISLKATRSYVPKSDTLLKLPAPQYKKIKGQLKTLLRQPNYASVQWIHLKPEHARIVANSVLEDYVKWLNALNKTIVEGSPYVYDEVLPIAMLNANGINYSNQLRDEPLTNFERRMENDPSPIVWKSLYGNRIVRKSEEQMDEDTASDNSDTVYDSDNSSADTNNTWVYLSASDDSETTLNKETSVSMNLVEALRISKQNQFAFFRKVSLSVNFKTIRPWKKI